MNFWNLPSADEVPTTTIFYDSAHMKREFERIAQERRDREDALEFLLYLARRDHRHLVIDRQYDAWVSVKAPPDEDIQIYVLDSSAIPTFHYHGAPPWNLTSSTGF